MKKKRITFNFKIRSLQVVNHIIALCGLAYAYHVGELSWSWLWVLIPMYIVMMPMGAIAGFHRLASHKSYKTSKFWEFILIMSGTIATLGSSIAWVATHRFHHVNAEKPADPHSPYINREDPANRKFTFMQAFRAWTGYEWDVENISPRYVIDLIHSPLHATIHRNYFKIIFAYVIILALINPWLVIFAYALPACMALNATSVVDVLAHRYGYVNYKVSDESRNLWYAQLITLGDGWHNNHHAKPSDWYQGHKWWELDPTGWFIALIRKK